MLGNVCKTCRHDQGTCSEPHIGNTATPVSVHQICVSTDVDSLSDLS